MKRSELFLGRWHQPRGGTWEAVWRTSLLVLLLLSSGAQAVTIAYWQFDTDGVPSYLNASVGGASMNLTQFGTRIAASPSVPSSSVSPPDPTSGFLGNPASNLGSVSSPAETANTYFEAGSAANRALNLAGSNQWSFEGWFLLSARPSTNLDVIFTTRSDSYGPGLLFDIREKGTSNCFSLFLSDGVTSDTFQPLPSITTNVWHHFALSFNGTNGVNGQFQLRLNQVLIGTRDIPATVNRAVLDDNDADRLHLMGRGANGAPRTSFHGFFDEFRITGLAPPVVPQYDWRNLRNGLPIPSEGYTDQPYVVINNDGSWLCTLTTSSGSEGSTSQHIIALLSTNQGRTWLAPVDIEPASAPEASWVMPLKVPNGRVYAFYTYNFTNIRSVRTYPSGTSSRVDTIGEYAFRYSDDGGRSWSSNRFHIPIPVTAYDRNNVYAGDVDGDGQVTVSDPKLFWGVGKPFLLGQTTYLGATKILNYGGDFCTASEGIVFRSDNLVLQNDPAQITWIMGPDGDTGLRTPNSVICEETEVMGLNDGGLYAVTRTVNGYISAYYSRNGAHTWTAPDPARYAPAGRPMKNPRANVTIRRFANGKSLLWYHNHSGTNFSNRNPGWLCGGVERDGMIYWSQPEILLYDPSLTTGISYPDLFQDGDRFYATETQKSIARVHEIDSNLVFAVWNQRDNQTLTTNGLARSWTNGQGVLSLQALPSLVLGGGFTIDFWVNLSNTAGNQVFFDARDASGKGVLLSGSNGTFRLTMSDGASSTSWDADAGALLSGQWMHAAVTVDGGPKIITWIINGLLQDGGTQRQYGWGRFPGSLDDVNGADSAQVATSVQGSLRRLRLYQRALLTSEAIGNFQAEAGEFFPACGTVVSPPRTSPSGPFQVGFAGIPNRAYRVDCATNLDGPWQIGFTHLVAGMDGRFEFVDPTAPAPSRRFYRIVCP